MNKILHEIQSIEGVIGILRCTRNGEIVGLTGNIASFNSLLVDFNNLPQLAKIIEELHFEKHGLQCAFENLLLDIRTFSHGFMIIISEPGVDILLLQRVFSELRQNPLSENNLFRIYES